jgi:hypothetical protein
LPRGIKQKLFFFQFSIFHLHSFSLLSMPWILERKKESDSSVLNSELGTLLCIRASADWQERGDGGPPSGGWHSLGPCRCILLPMDLSLLTHLLLLTLCHQLPP